MNTEPTIRRTNPVAFRRYAKALGHRPHCAECGEPLTATSHVEGQAGWYCCDECRKACEDHYDFRGDDPAKPVSTCPECGDNGPHDDNGCTGRSLTYCCRSCGMHFDAYPEAV